MFVPDVAVRIAKSKKIGIAQTQKHELIILGRYKTSAIASKIPLCIKGFLSYCLYVCYLWLSQWKRNYKSTRKSTTCCGAFEEFELDYLLSCIIMKSFGNWKTSVLTLEQLHDVSKAAVISSVNSEFQRIKLEDKRLFSSSNSWKYLSGHKLILPWNMIAMQEVCDPEMERESGLHF